MSVLIVGQGLKFTTIDAAVAAARPGDTIDVKAGTYTEKDLQITQNLTLAGVGGVVNIIAPTAISYGGNVSKALLIVGTEGDTPNVTIKGFSFSGAIAAQSNGAGIRYQSGNLTLINDTFTDNQDGVLATPFIYNTGTILVKNSTFNQNGAVSGLGHGMYIGYVNTFQIMNSVAENAVSGHEIKSRAFNTLIQGNKITDTTTGTASYSIDIPDGGNTVIKGNTITKGPDASTPVMIHIGGGEDLHPDSVAAVSGNTFIDNYITPAAVTAVWNQMDDPNVVLQGNRFTTNNPGSFLMGLGTLSANTGVRGAIPGGVSDDLGDPDRTLDLRGTTNDQSYIFTAPYWTVEAGSGHLTAITQKPGETVVGGSGGVDFTVSVGNGGSEVFTAAGSSNTITMNASAIVYSNGNDVINIGSAGQGHVSIAGAATVNTASGGITDYYIFGTATVNEQGGFSNQYQVEQGGTLNVSGNAQSESFNGQGGMLNFNGGANSGSIAGYFQAGSDQPSTMSITTWDNSLMQNALTLTAGNYNLMLDGGGSIDASADSGAVHVTNTTDTISFIGGSGRAYVYTGTGSAQITAGSGSLVVNEGAGPGATYYAEAGSTGTLTIQDFDPVTDQIVFGQGVTIAGQAVVAGNLDLTLSNGGSILLGGATQL